MDRAESIRRGSYKPRKTSTKHPYAAIEHRVIDSPAFADLKPSAVVVLLLMVRQLTKTNNGHLQATFGYMKERGIGSEHTLQEAIAQLISHGFIYRTRSHGANGAWARYAVTWLPVTEKTDLFLTGFESCAWRSWVPSEKKAPRKNCRTVPAKSAVSPANFLQKVQEPLLQKVQTMNLIPCYMPETPCSDGGNPWPTPDRDTWVADYLTRLGKVGLAGHQCFEVHVAKTSNTLAMAVGGRA